MKDSDITFKYIEELVDCIIDEVENDEDSFVAVIAKFDEAKEILKDAMTYENVNFESLKIESPIMDNYDDEFVLSFWMNDGVLEVGCEKLKNEDGEYLNIYGDIVFLFDNCSSKVIPLCESSELYFVNIEDDEDCDCCECDCCEDEPYVINVKVNLDTEEAEDIIRKVRNNFYREIAIFKELLDF